MNEIIHSTAGLVPPTGRYSSQALEHSLRNVQSYIRQPFLFENWYMVGFGTEFSRKLVAKTILDRSIVFFRKENGQLVALQNRCAHRSFPLSESHLDGDTIRCGYHGIRYDADGKILAVPCQDRAPAARLKAYDVHETGPFAWIWMGKGAGDISKIPDMSFYTDPRFVYCSGTLPMEGNYLLMQENLSDLSHLPYLHASTFGFPEIWANRPIELKVDDEKKTVEFWRVTRDWNVVKLAFPRGLHYEDRDILHRGGGRFETPAFFRGWQEMDINDAKPGEATTINLYIDHFMTPETHKSTHYYYAVARNCAIEDVEFTKMQEVRMKSAFAEDSAAVLHMQTLLDNDHHEFKELMIAGDKPSLATRRMVLKLVELEYGVPAGALESAV